MITYFIQSGDFVKIGTTSDIQSRVKALRHASPQGPVVLKTTSIPEREAHNIAGKITERANGEWFRMNEEMEKWIQSLESCQEGYDPEIRMPGRPATGKTKTKLSFTIDSSIAERASQVASDNRLSLSAYVERAIANYLQPEAQ